METPADPNRKRHQVQASERTLAILRAVLDHPGSTVKQLRDRITGQPSDQSLRDHLGLLFDGGWIRRTFRGEIAIGPTLAASDQAIRDFQMLLVHLRKASVHGMDLQEIAEATGLTPRAVSAAVTIGVEFDCMTPAGNERYRLHADGLLLPPCTASEESLNAVLEHFTAASGHDAALVHLSQDHGMVLSHVHPAPNRASLLATIPADAAHATASGQAALTWLDGTQRARYLATHGMKPFTDRTPTTVEALESRLVREPGRIHTAEGQFTDGGASLAIMVRNGARTDDRIVLTTTSRLERLEHDRTRLTTCLRETANALSTLIDGPL